MSPEQLRGDSQNIDSRTDVYALGVMLYALLCGDLPYNVTTMDLTTAIRHIQEVSPPALRTHNPKLDQDLDIITTKCLAKDSDGRYQTVDELRADLERWQRGEPILARRPTLWYQLRGLARRHRAWFIGAAGIALTLVAGVVVSTWLYFNAETARRAEAKQKRVAQEALIRAEEAEFEERLQRKEAEAQAQMAHAVNQFLNEGLLAAADPLVDADPDRRVRDLLAVASIRVENRFPNQPRVEASIRMTLGSAFLHLGDYPRAEHHLTRSVELSREHLGAEHEETLRHREQYAEFLTTTGQFVEGRQLLEELLETNDRLYGEQSPQSVEIHGQLGLVSIYEGQYEQAEETLGRVIETFDLALPQELEASLPHRNMLCMLYIRQERFGEAESLLLGLCSDFEKTKGEQDPGHLSALTSLSSVYNTIGRFDKAEPLLRRAWKIQEHVLGTDHRLTLTTRNNLAFLHARSGRIQEAIGFMRDILDATRRTLGQTHPDTLMCMTNLAYYFANAGQFDDAGPLFHRVRSTMQEIHGDENPNTIRAQSDLGWFYLVQSRLEEAEIELSEALDAAQSYLNPEDPLVIKALAYFGRLNLRLGEWEESEAALLESYDLLESSGVGEPAIYRDVMIDLISLYEKSEQPEEVETWKRRQREFLKR